MLLVTLTGELASTTCRMQHSNIAPNTGALQGTQVNAWHNLNSPLVMNASDTPFHLHALNACNSVLIGALGTKQSLHDATP